MELEDFPEKLEIDLVLQLMGVGFELGCDEGEFVSPTRVQSLRQFNF